MLTRRELIKLGLAGTAGLILPSIAKADYMKDRRWAFLIDTYKCVGCGFCVKACKLENEVPYDIPASRTWIERYVIKKDGTMLADSPRAGRDGFTTNAIERGHGHEPVTVPESEIAKTFFVPKLCNQCDKPACVQVCPVGATYQPPDGIVLIDRTWCIGCWYCIMACPYGVRFFHPVYKTAEKCNWCYHRISKGLKPACVEACPFGARQIGNIRNPEDPVAKTIMSERVHVLKEEYGTGPMAFYIGLDYHMR